MPTTMPERQDLAALLERHLGWIERVAAALCRKHGLDPDEVDDFTSWVKTRLVEDDYAILRKFRGESQLTTFLTVVLNRMYRDYRVAQLGRWRPSAAARRRGPAAVQLERLVYRDGMSAAQAAAALRSAGIQLSDGDAIRIVAELGTGVRGRPKQVGDAPLDITPAAEQADDSVLDSEAQAGRAALREVLGRAMEGLPAEDRRIVEMRFFGGATVADIARALRTEQKPLYRRLERILKHLRGRLEAEGFPADRVREIIDEDS
ncbi:MAG TPA: sigma-70 family RNA polymerase sigma factor [Longimicrobium sp.]